MPLPNDTNNDEGTLLSDFLFGPKTEDPPTAPSGRIDHLLSAAGSITGRILTAMLRFVVTAWQGTWTSLAMTLAAVGWVAYALVNQWGSGGTSELPASNRTPAITIAQASARITATQRDLQRTSSMLRTFGVPESTIQSQEGVTSFIQASQIGLAIQGTLTAENLEAPRLRTRTSVVGPWSPVHYATLQTLNRRAYALSINRSPDLQDILRNSAVIHEGHTLGEDR